MKVDLHAHCYPKPYVDELKRIGFGNRAASGLTLPQWTSVEERLETMDALGVDMQVMGISFPIVNFPDAETSKALAQLSNDYIADLCEKYPDRFMGLASIPLNHMKDALEELDRAMNVLKMDGVVLGTHINGRSLGEAQFLPLFEELDRRGIPVVLHPLKPPGEELMPEEFIKMGIPNSVGFVYETTKVMAQMVFRGTFEELKNLTFVLPHSGGTIPFVVTRWDIQYGSRPDSHPLTKLPHPPSHYLKRHYYDTALSYYRSCIRCTLDLVGVDHFVLGTDVPFSEKARMEETIQGVEDYGFSEEEKEKIYFKNAAKLFPDLRRFL